MKLEVPSQLRPMLGELKDSQRLQLGLGLIALVVLFWLMLVLGDWRAAKLEALQDARARLAKVQALAGQQAWIERADAAKQVADALQAEIPAAASPGLAQAEFQGWLRELANAQGVPVRLDVQAPVRLEQPADIVRVSATISGALSPDRAVQLIHRIEGHANLATIPISTIRSDTLKNRTFSITVQGFYRVPAGTPGA
ncbi:MAG: hypothetical protein ACREO4_15080 [Lysobacter sp.]